MVEGRLESSPTLYVKFLGLNTHMPLEHSGSGSGYASKASRGGKSEQAVDQESRNMQNVKARGPGQVSSLGNRWEGEAVSSIEAS